MKLTRNIKAISKLLLILLLLSATIIGAILSYLWVIGYIINLGFLVPEKTTVSITNATFTPQNTSYFTVTLLNPSYSPTDANITQIATSTEDGHLYNITEINPYLPYRLPKAEEKTFECVWNWANYTGETVKIIAFIADGSGPTFEAETPLVDLEITDVSFDPAISVTHFNMTVQNLPSSVTYVNITEVNIDREPIPPEKLSISLPYPLDPDESVPFTCAWDWTNYQDKNITIAVYTLQGYAAYHIHSTPKPVILTITDVLFNVTDTTHFNVTIHNSEDSPTSVSITRMTATMENGTAQEITEANPPLIPPYPLDHGANVTFRCSWNWADYREKNVTITVYTMQNFTVSSTQATTARVILAITEVLFDVADPSYFNVTIRDSEFSVEEYVNITKVTVTVENGTPEDITVEPPLTLYGNESVTFKCLWNWTNYWNKKVSITVHTLQGYSAYRTEVTPSPVIISDVLFNLSDTTHFNVAVRNSEFFSTYVLITGIAVTLENGMVQNVTVVAPARLPYVLHPNDLIMLKCSWDWSEYCDQNVTVVANTLQGYVAYRTERTPLPIIIEVTDVLFDITNTTYFNVTARNSEFSLEDANITKINLIMENGTTLEITEVAPSLPHMLSPNLSVTFQCSWNWTNYRGKNATIAVYTLQGYPAYYTQVTPEPVILTITDILFDIANTTRFNLTVHNSEFSLIVANITRITVTMENGTVQEITDVIPSLPYILNQNSSVTFTCMWNWTDYRAKNVIITVYTLEGYKALFSYITPS